MTYLLDTNVISEVRKTDRAEQHVWNWWSTIRASQLFLSVLTLGEIRKGIHQLERKSGSPAADLRRWLDHLPVVFSGRLLDVDQNVANAWGRINAKRPYPVIDSLLAATAIANQMVLVTRNTRDIEDAGAEILNPFEPVC